MKKFNKIIVLFLTLILVYTVSACQDNAVYVVSLDTKSAVINVGSTLKLTAKILRDEKDTDLKSDWSTDNSDVATVSDGLVTAVKLGKAVITARYKNASSSCVIIVSHASEIKNVILMIGDGMGSDHEEAGRIFSGKSLAWDDFPFKGKVFTTNFYGEITDSAAAATAMSTGEKTVNSYLRKDYNQQNLTGIVDYAKTAGKKTGVVTSDALCGATPSGFSAYSTSRDDRGAIIPSQITSDIDLLIGEGKSDYQAYSQSIIDQGYEYITGGALDDYADAQKIFATLSSIAPKATSQGMYELEALASFALSFLDNENGFFLMVEGAKIDTCSHSNDLQGMIKELMAFNRTVQTVLDWAKDRNDTIVIVTADHETGGLLIDGTDASWLSNGHTAMPVNYYVYGAYVGIIKAHIQNTDIFGICNSFMEQAA